MENTVGVGEEVTQDNYNKLKEELQDMSNENEDLRQKNHEQKRALNEALFSISTLTQECATFQLCSDELKKENDQKDQLIWELKKKINSFENEADLSIATDVYSDVNVTVNSAPHKNIDLLNENKALKEDMVSLKTAYSDCKDTFESKLQTSKTMFEELMCEKNMEIAELDLQLKCANGTVMALKDQVQTVQNDLVNALEQLSETKDDLVKCQSDLHIARAPVMQSRGNSIFSELEDNRQKYVSKYNDLKSKYTEVSKKCIRQSQDISRLMSEKVSTARLIQDMASEEEVANKSLIDALELRIRQLEEYNKQVTSELKIPIKIVSEVDSGTLKYVETLIADTKEANWALKKELNDRSVALLMNQQLTNTYFTDLRRYKAENMKLKCELGLKKSDEIDDNLDSGKCDADNNSLNAKVETMPNTVTCHLDSSSDINSCGDLVKVAKKLTFSDELPSTKSEMETGKDDAVEVVCGIEAAAVVQRMGGNDSADSNAEESIVFNVPKPVSKQQAKKSYPKLEISFKK